MTYLHCARCRLAISGGLNCMSPANCPRCIAREAVVSPLFASELNGVEMRAARERRRAPGGGRARTVFGHAVDRTARTSPLFAP